MIGIPFSTDYPLVIVTGQNAKLGEMCILDHRSSLSLHFALCVDTSTPTPSYSR